jgi:hypothetical protein
LFFILHSYLYVHNDYVLGLRAFEIAETTNHAVAVGSHLESKYWERVWVIVTRYGLVTSMFSLLYNVHILHSLLRSSIVHISIASQFGILSDG